MSATYTSHNVHFLREFLEWYYLERPKRIVKGIASYLWAFSDVFSFVYLLRTLFAPWKAIADAYPKKGFRLNEIAGVFALNMTARLIGAVIRLCVIAVGLVWEISWVVLSLAYLAVWILFPFLVIGAVFYILNALI